MTTDQFLFNEKPWVITAFLLHHGDEEKAFFLNRKETNIIYGYVWRKWYNKLAKRQNKNNQSKNSVRNYFFANAYKVNGSKVIHLSQKDLDAGMMC